MHNTWHYVHSEFLTKAVTRPMQIKHTMTKKLGIFVLLTATCLLLAALFILTNNTAKADINQQTARQLLSAGKILPLEKITKLAKEIKPGEVLETELEHKKGMYIYEVELLDAHSQVWEIKLDAKTGKLIKMELED